MRAITNDERAWVRMRLNAPRCLVLCGGKCRGWPSASPGPEACVVPVNFVLDGTRSLFRTDIGDTALQLFGTRADSKVDPLRMVIAAACWSSPRAGPRAAAPLEESEGDRTTLETVRARQGVSLLVGITPSRAITGQATSSFAPADPSMTRAIAEGASQAPVFGRALTLRSTRDGMR